VLGRRRLWKVDEQCRKTVGQLLELPGVQAAHCPLQCSNCAAGGSAQNLLAIRRGMNLHTSLITLVAASLNPAACDKSFQHVAHRGPLHPQT
jgi:hypothetical protein